MAKQFLIDEDLANRLIAHLADEPYREVHELCDGLLRLQEVPFGGTVTVNPGDKK